MATQKMKRSQWLSKLLGNDKADEVNQSLAQLEALLDKAGVAKKSVRKLHNGKFNKTAVKGMLEDLQVDIAEVLAPLSDNIPEDLVQNIISMVIAALADAGSDAPTEEAEDVEDVAEDEDILLETMMDDEEDDEELTKAVAQLADEVRGTHEFMAELTDALLPALKAVTTLAPLVRKADEIETLKKQVSAIQKAIGGKPKRASEADETLLERGMTEQIKKQAGGDTNLLKAFSVGG
jgi:cytochrome P450